MATIIPNFETIKIPGHFLEAVLETTPEKNVLPPNFKDFTQAPAAELEKEVEDILSKW